MRIQLRPPLFLVISTILFVFNSCKKNDIETSASITTSQDLDDYKFLSNNLKQFAIILAPIINNSETRNIVRNKAKEKFDQEYEVLIKDLFTNNLIQSLVSKEKSEKLHVDLLERSGTHLYPQIYIPRYQYLEDNSLNTSTSPQVEIEDEPVPLNPILVFYSGDPEVDSSQTNQSYPGYKIVENELVYYTMVDEEYANEHEVWIFSINETVNSFGDLPCQFERTGRGGVMINAACGGGGGGGGGSVNDDPDYDPTDGPATEGLNYYPDRSDNKINFMIQNMRVTIHNESWLSGASEVAIRAKLVCHNGRNLGIPSSFPDEYTSDQASGYIGRVIRKIKRRDIKYGIWQINVNYSLQSNWLNSIPSQDPVHFIYTIFERDVFPATLNGRSGNGFGLRYALNSPIFNEPAPEGGFDLFYRANLKDGGNYPYARSHFTNTLVLATANTYAGSGLVESSSGGIYFNTVLY